MFEQHTLDNGMTLLLAPIAGAESLTVFVLYGVGSRYETPDIGGISHFLEHMMFKGTTKRPTAMDIAKELDGYGAEYNAFTSKDYTGYYVKINAKKLEAALDVLSDMLYHSKFDEKELSMEKGVILEEKNMYEDNPMMHIEDIYEELLFGGNPLGECIIGTTESIKSTNREKMLAYKNAFYANNNGVIVVAGCITDETKGLVNTYFNQAAHASAPAYVSYVHEQAAPRVRLLARTTEQVQLALGFPAVAYNDKHEYALKLLAVILGGNMSSRLFINIRERRGLCYFIRSSVDYFQDTGAFTVRSGLDKTKIDEALQAILHEFRLAKDSGVTDEELSRAKEFIKGKTILAIEDSEAVADMYAKRFLLAKELISIEDRLKRFDAVTQDDMRSAIDAVFDPAKLNLAMIGPKRDESSLLPLLTF